MANGELTADVLGDEVGLRQLSLLGVANMDSSGLPPGGGREAGPFGVDDNGHSLFRTV